MHIVMFGPPGSGKGTQAKLLAEALDFPHIVAGDLLRAEKATGSSLGKKIASFIDKGQFVPSEVIIDLFMTRLPNKPAVLDGFPRTLDQAVYFGDRVADFVHLNVSDATIRQRLLSRGESRTDDEPEIIEERIYVYHTVSVATLEYYQNKNLVRMIDGERSIDKVHQDILKAVWQ